MQTDRQNQIIEAGLELISTKGIQGLTIKNLSKEIGISEPAIYRHFENKKETYDHPGALRSIRATTATLISVFVSTIWAFGLMAVLDIPIYAVSTMIPVMLIAIGVAYGIHFYNHLDRFYQDNPGAKKRAAVYHTIVALWKPLSMAAFTTMIGFVSLLTSQVYPIKYFGIFTAFVIFIAFALALMFLPAAVLLAGYRPKSKKSKLMPTPGAKLNSFTNGLLKKKKLVYISVAVVIAISVVGIQKVWINSSFLDKFEKDSDIVLTDGFELLGGANIFVGDRGRFGQYDDNDMVYTKIKYSF